MTTLQNQSLPQSGQPSKAWVKVLILTVALAVPAFLVSPNGPLGGFWAPAHNESMPMGIQLPLFVLLNLAEVITFGLGISFLVFGYPLVRAIAPASKTLTWAAYLATAWLLFSWWPHDSLHIHNGMDVSGLLAIEYGFHITLMISGVILASFLLTLFRERAAR